MKKQNKKDNYKEDHNDNPNEDHKDNHKDNHQDNHKGENKSSLFVLDGLKVFKPFSAHPERLRGLLYLGFIMQKI